MSEPLVSVVLPVFNGGQYLERAVRSILAQDHRAIEVIAIDDGSTDASLEVLQQLQGSDQRLHIISRENRGLVETLNEGLDRARGDFIARMDADDISYRQRFSRQLQVFREQPKVALCGTDFHQVFADDRPYDAWINARPDSELPILSKFFTAFRHSTVMFNRRIMEPGLLRYDAAYPHAEDFDLFRRITAAHPGAIIHEPLLAYRLHGASVTSTATRQMRRTHLRIVGETMEEMGVRIPMRALLALTAPAEQVLDEMAALFDAVCRCVETCPNSDKAAYELGRDTLFFFLREMAMTEFGMEFAARFLDRNQGWRRMRRREAYMLQALRRTPVLANWAWRAIRTVDQAGQRRVVPPDAVAQRAEHSFGISS